MKRSHYSLVFPGLVFPFVVLKAEIPSVVLLVQQQEFLFLVCQDRLFVQVLVQIPLVPLEVPDVPLVIQISLVVQVPFLDLKARVPFVPLVIQISLVFLFPLVSQQDFLFLVIQGFLSPLSHHNCCW